MAINGKPIVVKYLMENHTQHHKANSLSVSLVSFISVALAMYSTSCETPAYDVRSRINIRASVCIRRVSVCSARQSIYVSCVGLQCRPNGLYGERQASDTRVRAQTTCCGPMFGQRTVPPVWVAGCELGDGEPLANAHTCNRVQHITCTFAHIGTLEA